MSAPEERAHDSAICRRVDAMTSRNPRVGPYGMWALATLVVVNSLLLVPQWIASGGIRPHWIALEALIVIGAFLALPPRRWVQPAAWIVSALLVAFGILLLGDATARTSLARPLNLYLDLQLLDAVSNLLSGSLGPALGLLVLVVGVVVAGGSFVVLAVLLETLTGLADADVGGQTGAASRRPSDRRAMWVGAALVVVGLALIPLRWAHPGGVVFGLTSVQLVREQTRQAVRMVGERTRFAAEFDGSPSLYEGTPGLLAGLGGRDVVMAFVESYGMTVLDDERYAPVVRPRLAAMEEKVAAAGLHMATGALVAPSQGGQSWLGHGSVLSGLWLENQLRYDLLLASERGTLVDDFRAAGYSTVAIMPAITMAWPEGERFGYDRIYAHADIDYRGPALNWVTMPDQFTWSFLQRAVLDESRDGPVFAEVGLISSHAPWTPILPLVESWDSVGDGTIFERWADAGETPEELWRDSDRVRDSYALAVGYAVDVLGSYAATFVDDGMLLLAMGDHQPAPLITGDEAPRTVPIHVYATDPELIAPFLAWGFAEGALPPQSADPPRMDAFRDWFVRAFSTSPSASGP